MTWIRIHFFQKGYQDPDPDLHEIEMDPGININPTDLWQEFF